MKSIFRLYNILNSIFIHPLTKSNKLSALGRFLRWQLGSLIYPYPILYPFIHNSKFLVSKGMAGATNNIYTGLYDFEDMGFVLHFLRSEDLFVDIGANVGSYTILASAVKKAKSISIEPVPSTFQCLKNNILINDINESVKLLNVGLGSKESIQKYTSSSGPANHIVTKKEETGIEIPTKSLDSLLGEVSPVLLKIDVEGYETEVLLGAEGTLKTNTLKAIIIELNGLSARYGFDESKIHNLLLKSGFAPYKYNPFERSLKPLESYGTHNTIYIKDLNFVKKRVKAAKMVKVLNHEF